MKTIVLGPPGTGITRTLLNKVDDYLKKTDPAIYMDLNDGPPVEDVIDNMKETNLNLWGENE